MQKVRFFLSSLILLSVSFGYAQLPLSADANLKQFVYSEQVLNDKVENLKVFHTIKDVTLDSKYRPESQTAFQLDTYLVPAEDLVIIKTNENFKLPSREIRGQSYLNFFVHPVSAPFFEPYTRNYMLSEEKFMATPLSSFRSLIAWAPVQNEKSVNVFGVKVSLDSEIGGTRRLLTRSQIERAAATSLAINQADLTLYHRIGAYFIDEPASVYLKNHPYGFSYRETPFLEKNEVLIPLFSLYSKRHQNQSLLQSLIIKSGLGHREFVRRFLIVPMTQHMLTLYFEDGLITEPHEQNVCVKLKDGNLTTDFYYRDLAGFHFDPEMRVRVGKNMDFIPANFQLENLKLGRAKLIENLQSYLINSNFFALKSSVESGSISMKWIEELVWQTVKMEILNRTGFNVNNWSSAKAALTRYKTENFSRKSCHRIFGAEL